jgi:hypothetical protein
MDSLKTLDGVWEGTGWTLSPSGEKITFTQTIRAGSAGEGAIKVIEGRSYDAGKRLTSTNFEIISFNAPAKTYSLRLYSQGNSADVPIRPTGHGFTLEYPQGGATVRFTINAENGVWREVAEQRTGAQTPVRFLELTLRRVGATDWPAAGAVPPR